MRSHTSNVRCVDVQIFSDQNGVNKMKRMWFLVLFLTFVWQMVGVAPARADISPASIKIYGQCVSFTLCNAQTVTGDCTSGGDEIVLDVFGKWSSLTFFSNKSVGSPYSCAVHGNNDGHDAESGDFVKLNDTQLTATDEAISLNGGNFGHIWISCGTITTSVTITVNACPSSR